MTTNDAPDIRQLLRRASRPDTGDLEFDTAAAPADPMQLFVDWLTEAVDGGMVQPQAMTLATVALDGGATARTLLLKDLDDAVWFATSSLSPKGRQIAEDPEVALTLYWREQGRQIRVRGRATPGPRDVSASDFTARHPDSRAVAVAMIQSDPIDDAEDADRRLADAKQRIAADDEFAPSDWTAYRVDPSSVEFWQATTGRDQVRLRYARDAEGSWSRSRLWP